MRSSSSRLPERSTIVCLMGDHLKVMIIKKAVHEYPQMHHTRPKTYELLSYKDATKGGDPVTQQHSVFSHTSYPLTCQFAGSASTALVLRCCAPNLPDASDSPHPVPLMKVRQQHSSSLFG
jgi:hypothetical protein